MLRPCRSVLPTVPLLLATAIPAQSGYALTRNTVHPPFVAFDGIYDVSAGDVDGDGDVDLVYGCDHDPNRLFLNDGRGGFVDGTAGRLVTPTVIVPPATVSNATYEVDLVDLDGDGDLDLLCANDHYLLNRAYLNAGNGFFTDVTATHVPPDADYSIDQVVADFDGDGDADWLVVNYGPCRLYENNGAGVFTDVTAARLPGMATNTVFYGLSFAADLDNDGDQDVVLNHGASTTILRNQAGVLLPWGGTFPGGGVRVLPADVDGDGRIDLLTANGRLLHNTGSLTFVDLTATHMPAGGGGSLNVVADVDLDGDLDAIGPGRLLRNDGTGVFTATVGLAPSFLGAVAVAADLDGDGDPDLVHTSTPTEQSPWINHFTQVRTLQAPVRGLSYTIRFQAPVRATPVVFGPAVANAGTLQPLPPFGTLRIDLLQGTFLWPLVDTTGTSTITWTIPNLPALVGTELHYQSVVFDPLRAPFLTNAVRDVIQ